MSQQTNPWARADAGASTPQYFDGQVLAAADLALGQEARDAELARMRVLLHGWGVVAGLIPGVSGGRLLITPGYGVLPGGGELYLPEPMDLTLPTGAELAAHCGAQANSCELPSAATGAGGQDATAQFPSVWLAVGSTRQAAAPRSAPATGCTHPGNTARPTRWCHGVALYLLCELPDNHAGQDPSCEQLGPYLCGPELQPVPLPDPVPGPDVLVLGQLTPARGESDAVVAYGGRRPLLPNHVLQAWLRSCICPLATKQPTVMDWTRLMERLVELGFDQPLERRRLAALFSLYTTESEERLSAVIMLLRAGITGPALFLDTDQGQLATITHLSAARITQVVADLQRIRAAVGF